MPRPKILGELNADLANRRAVQAREAVRQLLEERKAFALARLYGLCILV